MAPCICSAANPCSVDLNGTYTVNNVPVSFTQKLAGGGSNNCNTVTCTCVPATTRIDSKTGHVTLVCKKMKEE